MLVKVKEKYFDKDDGDKLRLKGQILDIEDEARAKKLISLGYLLPVKPIKVTNKNTISKEEVLDETVDIGKLSKDEIKAILDKEGVKYKASDSKDQLLKLLEK